MVYEIFDDHLAGGSGGSARGGVSEIVQCLTRRSGVFGGLGGGEPGRREVNMNAIAARMRLAIPGRQLEGAPSGPGEQPATTSEFAEQVLRQVRAGVPDGRLLPSPEKAAADVRKKLDRLANRSGWHTFLAGQAHAVQNAKAKKARQVELMAVREVLRWRGDVEEHAPERLEEFDQHVARALANPAPVPQRKEE